MTKNKESKQQMVNNRMTEGVGKKIVEALKKQTDVEISPYDSVEPTAQVDTPISFNESIPEFDLFRMKHRLKQFTMKNWKNRILNLLQLL